MRELRKLMICNLTYRVVLATAEEVPELATADGWCQLDENTIYIHEGLETSRTRDTLMHEVGHAFIEASGLGQMFKNSLASDKVADRFEEALIRVAVPWLLRLVDDNGKGLLDVPKTKAKGAAARRTAAKSKVSR